MKKQTMLVITVIASVMLSGGCEQFKTKQQTLEDGAYYLVTSEVNSVHPGRDYTSVRTVTLLKKRDNEFEMTGFGLQTATGTIKGDEFTMRTKDGGSYYVFEGVLVQNNLVFGGYTRGALNEVGDVGKGNSFQLTQSRSKVPENAEWY